MRSLMRIGSLTFAICFVWGTSLHGADYKIDPAHSTVAFKVRHLVSQVSGRFNEFEGSFSYEPDRPETWKAEATINVASIDTNVADRDNHLRSADFFDVATYPIMTFQSTGVEQSDVEGDKAKLHGLLTIHGVERPVVLDLTIHGVAQDPWGNVRAGFTATTRINRRDFGLEWNKVLETGQLLVGEEVDVILEIEGIQQKGSA